jgi:hypothetical protein
MKVVKRNVLKVNEHHSFMFGLGVAPRYLERYYAGEHTPKAAAKLLGYYVVDGFRHGKDSEAIFRPAKAEVRVDDGKWRPVELRALFSSFVEELALRFKCFPRAGWDRGLFESLIIEAGPLQVAAALPFLWIGSTRPLPGFERVLSRSLELRLERPEFYTLDGELYKPADRFQVSAGPELRFVLPVPRLSRLDPHWRVEKIGPWDLRYLV